MTYNLELLQDPGEKKNSEDDSHEMAQALALYEKHLEDIND